jgi:hypothetical protein
MRQVGHGSTRPDEAGKGTAGKSRHDEDRHELANHGAYRQVSQCGVRSNMGRHGAVRHGRLGKSQHNKA